MLNMGDIFERIRKQSAEMADIIQEEPSKSILVVDDSLTTRTLVTGVLEVEGYQVSLAKSGEEALEILEGDSFNLVITDVEMPGINGFELSEKIRKSEKDKEIPIVILSSLANEKDKRRGIAVGANAYFVKGSFEHAPFLEMVETLI